jgi:putative serine protease PepD
MEDERRTSEHDGRPFPSTARPSGPPPASMPSDPALPPPAPPPPSTARRPAIPPTGSRSQAVHGAPTAPGRVRRVAAFVTVALVVAAGGYGIRAATAPSATPPSVSTGAAAVSANLSSTEGVAALVKASEPAIVRVTSQVTVSGSPFQPAQTGTLEGTGFVVSPDGLILTNAHVIEDSNAITVTLADGTTHDATVVRSDPTRDLAVLRIDATNLPTLRLETSSTPVGASVVAIGYALGLEGDPTVTTGIVSSADRTIQVQDEVTGVVRTYPHILQISAPINSGNSGGPVLDANGKVIAIATAGASSAEDIGFAIPIDRALSLLANA